MRSSAVQLTLTASASCAAAAGSIVRAGVMRDGRVDGGRCQGGRRLARAAASDCAERNPQQQCSEPTGQQIMPRMHVASLLSHVYRGRHSSAAAAALASKTQSNDV
jgi:hypothetical protein